MRVVGALFALAACGSTTTAVRAPNQRLVNAGSEPRRILRAMPTPHLVEMFDVIQKRRMTARTQDTVLEMHDSGVDLPSTKISAHLRDGELQIDDAVLVDDVLDPRLRVGIARELEKLKGRRFTVTEGLPEIGKLSVGLPSEAVGIGADWIADDAPVIDAVHWQRHSTFHVRELTPNAATLDVTVQMRADSQALSVEPNATTRLTSGSGNAAGTVTVRFDRAVSASDMHGTTEVNLLIVRGHARVARSVTSEFWLAVTPRE
jgi:hypothetical protein